VVVRAIGVRAGGLLRMLLFKVLGLEVMILYGETALAGVGEIRKRDFCWFCRKLCGITIICGPLFVCILTTFLGSASKFVLITA